MNWENNKCVIVIDESQSLGNIANISAILGITIGMKTPDAVGSDVSDTDGNIHAGIIQLPVPILKGSRELLRTLRAKLFERQYSELTVVDFSELAKGCKTYEEYIRKMSQTPEEELKYIGIALCGSRKKINSLTGNLPLLR